MPNFFSTNLQTVRIGAKLLKRCQLKKTCSKMELKVSKNADQCPNLHILKFEQYWLRSSRNFVFFLPSVQPLYSRVWSVVCFCLDTSHCTRKQLFRDRWFHCSLLILSFQPDHAQQTCLLLWTPESINYSAQVLSFQLDHAEQICWLLCAPESVNYSAIIGLLFLFSSFHLILNLWFMK